MLQVLRYASASTVFVLLASLSGACSGSAAGDASDERKPTDGDGDGNSSGSSPSSSSGGSGSTPTDGPHALGTVVLGEMHPAGQGSSFPIVSAVFVPSTSALAATCSTVLDGCEIFSAPRCDEEPNSNTGCAASEACVWSTSCASKCQRVENCEEACGSDEVCTSGTCKKIESFDAGPLAFAGTTTALTLYPPYAYSGSGEGAPFLAGAEIRVQAQGASEAGFAAFDESFRSTTFLQTKPSLDKITREKAFGRGPLAVGWIAGTDTVQVAVASAYHRAECTGSDAAGSFEVPRSVLDRILTNAEGKREDRALAITVTRTRTEVRKAKATKGKMQSTRVEAEGWLELSTVSTETAQLQGCGSGVACGDDCVDLDNDPKHCGACGTKCSGSQTCKTGACKGTSTSGLENTLELCSDGISNDGDSYIDCDDYDCCGVRSCPSGTACTP